MSSALQPKHRWTYSDLVALPDDQLRHELIDGEHSWIVDPDARSVTVLRRPRPDGGLTDVSTHSIANDDSLVSPLFPGLKIRLRDVFRSARDRAAARK